MVKNEQSNGICEMIHQSVLNMLRIHGKTQLINNHNDACHVMKKAIAACVHATCCAVNYTIRHSPGEIVAVETCLWTSL